MAGLELLFFLFHYMYEKAKIWTSQILRLAILKSVKLSLIDDKLSAEMVVGLKIWERKAGM
jgi:hypothetical protein